jgi:hypothetical protein
LIEPFVKGNWDVNVEAILKNTNLIESAAEYDVDTVMDHMEKEGKGLYLVKRVG